MSSSQQSGLPGIRAARNFAHRRVRASDNDARIAPGIQVIDGTKTRDTGNTGNIDTIRAGKVMGKITASGKWANSFFGQTAEAIDSTETAVDLPEAVGDELVRRVGSTGTFKIIGPPTAAGTVRTLTATYSGIAAAGGGVRVATITALGVNEVQTLNWTNSPSGTFRIGIVDSSGKLQYTQPITYSATPATLVSNINTALDAVLGAGLVVASGSAVTAIALTFSGAGYAALPQTLVVIDTDALTAGDVDITRTTTGVDGRFVTGSLVAATDGSETPRGLIDDGYGIKVTDDSGTSEDQFIDGLLFGGHIDTSQILDVPADTSTLAWLKAQLKANGVFTFDDDV